MWDEWIDFLASSANRQSGKSNRHLAISACLISIVLSSAFLAFGVPAEAGSSPALGISFFLGLLGGVNLVGSALESTPPSRPLSLVGATGLASAMLAAGLAYHAA